MKGFFKFAAIAALLGVLAFPQQASAVKIDFNLGNTTNFGLGSNANGKEIAGTLPEWFPFASAGSSTSSLFLPSPIIAALVLGKQSYTSNSGNGSMKISLAVNNSSREGYNKYSFDLSGEIRTYDESGILSGTGSLDGALNISQFLAPTPGVPCWINQPCIDYQQSDQGQGRFELTSGTGLFAGNGIFGFSLVDLIGSYWNYDTIFDGLSIGLPFYPRHFSGTLKDVYFIGAQPPENVPEPATALLLLSGVIGAARRRRKRFTE